MSEGKLLWQPPAAFTENSNIFRFAQWLGERQGRPFVDYTSLWKWSVDNIPEFWAAIAQYFEVKFHEPYAQVLQKGDENVFKAKWFEGAKLNYAEHVFRNRTDEYPALVWRSEVHEIREISWRELEDKVSGLAEHFRSVGLQKGDRVVAFLPNIPEAVIAFLAANSLGLVWSSCSPDFGAGSVLDRFRQIEPKVLIVADGYNYNGKYFDRSEANKAIADGIPGLEEVIYIPFFKSDASPEGISNAVLWQDALSQPAPLSFTPVEFDHPQWVMFSSGTTGKPKAITHGTGGMLLEHLKALSLHQDVKKGERFFWYSTTGWMMWNYANAALLAGGTVCIYEGSTAYPDIRALWNFARDARINHFGAGAAFYLACMKAGLEKKDFEGLDSVRTIGYTGSPLPAEGWEWIYNTVKKDLWLISLSGGTDVCSGFVGGNPYDPVYAGETQCRKLGCKLEAYDEMGNPVVNEVGEMVITEPMPCMPVFFWNDEGDIKYRGSYFEDYPGIWRHGDWVKISDRGTITIYGRSDATLNRGGVRIGSSEVYSAAESVPEVLDSLVLCMEKEGGEFYMPLYVVLKEGVQLTDDLKKRINTELRTRYSPRHVPDAIIQVPEIPYTISGKKMEMPLKKILMGAPVEKVLSKGAMRNPGSLEWFINDDLSSRR